jgi:hypothetical protein
MAAPLDPLSRSLFALSLRVDVAMSILSGRRPFHSPIFWRATHVVCVLLVFSYILFDALDLDGSNFPKLLMRVERAVVVAVVPSSTPIIYSSEESEFCGDISLLFADRSAEYSRPLWVELLTASPLGTARSHGYRVGLARNSLPNSSPYL